MTFATTAPRDASLTRTGLATTVDARSVLVSDRLRRAGPIIGDLFAALGIAFCIPFVILALGSPVALSVRLLLWIAGMVF